jgi:hypothetical protein
VKSVCTVNQDNTMLATPRPATRVCCKPVAELALTSTIPTVPRLATAAINTIRSVTAWPGSLRVEWAAVADALIGPIASHTQPVNTSAAVSQPTNGA